MCTSSEETLEARFQHLRHQDAYVFTSDDPMVFDVMLYALHVSQGSPRGQHRRT
jgi:hypothetical protein